MNRQKRIEELKNMEALAEYQIEHNTKLLNECRKARRKLEGVSTSSNARKGREAMIAAQVIAKRNQRLFKA